MKKIVVSLLVLVVAGGTTYYFVFKDLPREDSEEQTYNYSNQVETTQTPATSETATLEKVTVSIKGFAYNPKVLNIKAGTKVTWVNNDAVSHTVTSDSGGLLDSGLIAPGASFSFTFSNPGSESYYCAPHPMMKGSVVVTE